MNVLVQQTQFSITISGFNGKILFIDKILKEYNEDIYSKAIYLENVIANKVVFCGETPITIILDHVSIDLLDCKSNIPNHLKHVIVNHTIINHDLTDVSKSKVCILSNKSNLFTSHSGSGSLCYVDPIYDENAKLYLNSIFL